MLLKQQLDAPPFCIAYKASTRQSQSYECGLRAESVEYDGCCFGVCVRVCVCVRVDDRTDLSTVIGLLQISFLRAEERKCQERDQQGSCLLKNLDAISLSMPCARCECV